MKRGKDGQIKIPHSWADRVEEVYRVELETRDSCAVVARDPLPGAAVITLAP